MGIYAVDSAGDIVWYYDARESAGGDCVAPNGKNLLYAYGPEWKESAAGIVEIDEYGTEVRHWVAGDTYVSNGIPVPEGAIVVPGLSNLHHALATTPAGNILTIVYEDVLVSDVETRCSDPFNTTSDVIRGDRIVESVHGVIVDAVRYISARHR